ncbi:hypothetical protein PATSB16_08370 [Pandoraea thiooxydans]|nr:hypothetical protein PATSB16_08370 [Pandoraea thiooxydans]
MQTALGRAGPDAASAPAATRPRDIVPPPRHPRRRPATQGNGQIKARRPTS